MATRRRDTMKISEYAFVLTNGVTATQGERACGDTSTGLVTVAGTSTTLVALGFFAETVVGDGTKTVRVFFETEATAEWMTNDTAGGAIAAANVFSEVYMKDGKTVSITATGRSKGGRVIAYDATANLVLVQGGIAITGPTGAAGLISTVASRTALSAIAAGSRADGMVVMSLDDRSLWEFNATQTGTMDGATSALSNLLITPDAGTGRWIRADKSFDLKIAIDKTMLDAAVLCTVPAGFALRLNGLPFWDVVVGWTGGAASAIGISSANAAASTKGDLLGGAAGDVTATLGTAGVKAGILGGKLDTLAHIQAIALVAADIIRFDRITSAYTAGSGFVHIPVTLAAIG